MLINKESMVINHHKQCKWLSYFFQGHIGLDIFRDEDVFHKSP